MKYNKRIFWVLIKCEKSQLATTDCYTAKKKYKFIAFFEAIKCDRHFFAELESEEDIVEVTYHNDLITWFLLIQLPSQWVYGFACRCGFSFRLILLRCLPWDAFYIAQASHHCIKSSASCVVIYDPLQQKLHLLHWIRKWIRKYTCK